MRKPTHNIEECKKRRARLATVTAGGAVIVPAHPDYIRNNDVAHDYRQDTNFYYLTGFEEPESIFVFRPGQTPESILFVREKNVERETWDGFRYGIEGARVEFQMDATYPIEEFDTKIAELLKPCNKVYYHWGIDREFDLRILHTLDQVRTAQGRFGKGFLPVFDSWEPLAEMRLFKSQFEISELRAACEITAKAHAATQKYVKPGMSEREIEGFIVHQFLSMGAAREGYGHIVASGASACTLHYRFNDQICRDGDLILIDAGAERNYFTGDITRTFPINGQYTKAQRTIYDGVLTVQKAIIDMIKPGLPFKSLQDTTIEMLTDFMIEVGILTGSRQANIESLAYKKYYPHGVSHWLGMDVHDLGQVYFEGDSRKLEPSMCFTVEPGLYIPPNDENAPSEFRGIGVRIEDNVVVTHSGCENMTVLAPK